MEPSLNRRTWDAIIAMIRNADWSGLAVPIVEVIFFLLVVSAIAMYRWLRHRRRATELDRQLKHWGTAIIPTFRSLPLNEQLGSISLLRDLSGHPAYIVRALVGLRVTFETADVSPSILQALDRLAEERRAEIHRKLKKVRTRAKQPLDR